MSTLLPPGLPAPADTPEGLFTPFWQGLREGVLRVTRCGDCGSFIWLPEWICHHCHSLNIAWEMVAPRGVLHSLTRAAHPTHPALRGAAPYYIALVELPHAGGIRVIGNLALAADSPPPAIGDPLIGVFEDHSGTPADYSLLHWQRAP